MAAGWTGFTGWTREFSDITQGKVTKTVVRYTPFAEQALLLEPPSYFKTDEPDAALMTYGQLKDYVAQLQASGYNVMPYMVALQRKVAFPFVTVVMTLLAVPFAVTTGRRGAMYGIGDRHRARHHVLADAERVRGDRRRRPALADARGVGAEHPLRGCRGVPDSHGENVTASGFGLSASGLESGARSLLLKHRPAYPEAA